MTHIHETSTDEPLSSSKPLNWDTLLHALDHTNVPSDFLSKAERQPLDVDRDLFDNVDNPFKTASKT